MTFKQKNQSNVLTVKIQSFCNIHRALCGKICLSFSGGKDSIATALLLKAANIKFDVLHYYIIDGLDFVEKQFDYFKNHFNLDIIKLPHPMLFDHLRHADYMTLAETKYLDQYYIPKHTFCAIAEEFGLKHDLTAIGIKAGDSMFRRKRIIEHKNKKEFYPVGNFSNTECLEMLKINNYELPDIYKHLGTSFDALMYDMLIPVKKHYPNDYKKIKEVFPLIDVEEYRYGHRCR